MPDVFHVLVVDDDTDVRGLLAAVLENDGTAKVTEAASGAEAMNILGREEFDVAVVDLQLPDHSGLEVLRWARAAEIDTELIVLTGHADVESAVEAMRLGAYDFITKPCKNAELREVVAKAFEKKALRRENSALKEVITRRYGLPTIVGASPEIREVLAVITREAANGGTLFLDEIGEMSPAMQVRLLRVLDSGEVRRVGEERVFHVDVRVVAATAKDLAREAGDAHFRWDLFYRVSTIVIPVPPLRRRRSDIPMLVDHFLGGHHARKGKALHFSPDAVERLIDYGWPGNIRELRNLVERLHILHEGSEVRAGDLPAEFGRAASASAATPAAPTAPAAPEPAGILVPLADVERRHVEQVLQATAWNKARAARVLEVDIKTLNKKIRDFKLAPAD